MNPKNPFPYISDRLKTITNSKKGIFLLFFLIVFTFITYQEFLSYESIGGDFFAILHANARGISKIVSSSLSGGLFPPELEMYRPVYGLTIHFDYALNGLDMWGYQLTNLLLSIVSIVFVYLLARHIFHLSRKVAFLASFIFAIHPINMYTLPFVQQRPEILATIFIILTIVFLDRYLRTSKRIWQILGVMTSFLAYMSKESAIVLIGLVVFYLMVKKKNEISIKKFIKDSAPFFISFIAYFLIKISILGRLGVSRLEFGDFPLFLAKGIYVVASMFRNLIYPIDLLGVGKFNITSLLGREVSLLLVLFILVSLFAVFYFTLYIFRILSKRQKGQKLFNWKHMKKIFTLKNFLLFWVLSYLILYLVYGQLSAWYVYPMLVPISIFLSSYFFEKKNTPISCFKKIVFFTFVAYMLLASPLFTNYNLFQKAENANKNLVTDLMNHVEDIPSETSIYMINYYVGVPYYSVEGLLKLKYPSKNWRIIGAGGFKVIGFSVFNVVDVEREYSVNCTLEKCENRIKIFCDGENVEFYECDYRTEKNVKTFTDENNTKLIITIENYDTSDYLLICEAINSTPHISSIIVENIL